MAKKKEANKIKTVFKKQQSPLWKGKEVNVKSQSALVLLDNHKMVFTGWLAELMLRDYQRKRKPRDLQFWIFVDNDKPEGRGRVMIGKKEFIFPFSQDLHSFLILTELIKNPELIIPPVGKITLFLDYEPKPVSSPNSSDLNN